MNGSRKPNAMLIELVIVILFFSISAGIILQLFVAASNKSIQSSADTSATLIAEDVAERFAVSREEADTFFSADGWTQTEDGYERQTQAAGRTYRVAVQCDTQETAAGTYDAVTVSVYDGAREAIVLPADRYLPKEATP